MMITRSKPVELEKLSDSRVLVIGDVMLDRFVHGAISRISPEAPVPVLRSARAEAFLGGAGNVVRNLAGLGSQPYFVSVIGEDSEAAQVKTLLSEITEKVQLVPEGRRPTTIKTRFIAEGQQVLRVDRETTEPIDACTIEEVLKAVQRFISDCQVVILSDYAKGLLVPDLVRAVADLARKAGASLLVDPKGRDYSRYSGATLLTPNVKELAEATGMPIETKEQIISAAAILAVECDLDAVLVTRGRDGMTLLKSSGEVHHFSAEAKEVFDVTGAGDTVIATLAACIGAGAELADAAQLANVAAGIVVGKVGTAVVYPADLIKKLHNLELSGAESKIVDAQTLLEEANRWRRRGLRIGFTSGIFDLLHPGHIRLLTEAAKMCDRLIVGLNGDNSAGRIRNQSPVQSEAARSMILASLEMVDRVVIFQEESAIELIAKLQPDVIMTGTNYKPHQLMGAEAASAYRGRIVSVEMGTPAWPDRTQIQAAGGRAS